jgi:hypothetical protein
MPSFAPIKRRDLIRYLIQMGFDGPYSGGRHQFMVKGHSRYSFPIRMMVTSVEIYSPRFLKRPTLIGLNGKNFRGGESKK